MHDVVACFWREAFCPQGCSVHTGTERSLLRLNLGRHSTLHIHLLFDLRPHPIVAVEAYPLKQAMVHTIILCSASVRGWCIIDSHRARLRIFKVLALQAAVENVHLIRFLRRYEIELASSETRRILARALLA